jgi:glutamine amidotransferase
VTVRVVVLEMGTANLFSLASALRFLGVPFEVTAEPAAVSGATHLVLPGVGAFDPAMRQLEAQGLVPVIRAHALERRRPMIGVCLGMQLLFEGSDEGMSPGLGLLPGRLARLQPRDRHRVPHVGFSPVHGFAPTGLFDGFADGASFYFTHSHALGTEVPGANAALCTHAAPFTAAVQAGNICGVQFHPEKSQGNGLRLLSNFVRLPAGKAT